MRGTLGRVDRYPSAWKGKGGRICVLKKRRHAKKRVNGGEREAFQKKRVQFENRQSNKRRRSLDQL